MKQTREINHGDGHIDIETLFGDVWAVTKCNLEVAMYNGYTESQAQTNARAWNIAMQSVGYMRDFRPLNTEAEADAIYAFTQAAEAGDKKTDFNTPKPRIIVSQSWLDKHTNNGIDDLKPTFGKIDIIGGTRNK